MSVQDYFDRLGASLETAWAKAGRDEESFPTIARDQLLEHPPLEHFDRDAFVAEQLDPTRPARRQLAPVGAFGQPGFTVFHGHGFLVDVYLWVNSVSAIHNHPFCGLFVLLDGYSVHAAYSFEQAKELEARVLQGTLQQTELELVEAGHVRMFSLREHPLVHALIHVPVGAISMVVRTSRTVGYQRYFPPSLAIALEAQDDIMARRIELLETLRRAHDERFEAHLRRFLASADFESVFVVLTRLWADCDDDTRAALLETVREHQGEPTDLLPRVMERSRRWFEGDTLRQNLHDHDDRFIATALMLAETRQPALDLIGRRHDDPVLRLHRFVEEVTPFDADDDAAPVLARALVDGLDVAEAERRLADVFGSDNVPAGQRLVIERHQRESLFSALGR